MVKPLAEEINSINSTLSRKGVSEQIGSKCLVYLPELDITSCYCCCCFLLLLFLLSLLFLVVVVVVVVVVVAAVSISSLKHIAKSKSQHLPTLSLVIPYLEVSPKQEYLVERIRGK